MMLFVWRSECLSSRSAFTASQARSSRDTGKSPSSLGLADFDLLRVIGRGSYAKVLLVQLKKTERIYAMKVVKKELVNDDEVNDTNVLHTIKYTFKIKILALWQFQPLHGLWHRKLVGFDLKWYSYFLWRYNWGRVLMADSILGKVPKFIKLCGQQIPNRISHSQSLSDCLFLLCLTLQASTKKQKLVRYTNVC